jgi:membrane protein insertase Oxa1/YidC/SpoIIIJ
MENLAGETKQAMWPPFGRTSDGGHDYVMEIISIITSYFGALFALGVFVADILIAMAVFRDATARENTGKKLMFMTPGQWSFVCLITCLAGLAVYWVIHYSNFSKNGGEEGGI